MLRFFVLLHQGGLRIFAYSSTDQHMLQMKTFVDKQVERLKQLRDMGFCDKEMCFQCLVEGDGDVSLAAALLLPPN